MNKTLLALLVSGLLLGGVPVALAGDSVGTDARETDPYCMKDYPGIGWGKPDQLPNLVDHQVGPTPAFLTVCEGEHWDGQDSVKPSENDEGTCTGQTVDVENDAYNVAVFQCADPGRHVDVEAPGAVGVRYSAQGDKEAVNTGALYLAVRISGVGDAILFTSGCHNLLGQAQQFGHAGGSQDCEGDVGEGALGVYLQDNTPFQLNVLAAVVSAARLTKGYVDEGDCSQADYKDSADATNGGGEPTCGRDNTAISVELLV